MTKPDLRPPHTDKPAKPSEAPRATEVADATERAIRRRAERMQHRRQHPGPSPLRGLSALGVLGWSVALPTVGGALLGLWLEQIAPQSFSWPLALMLGGLVIGAIVAWEWMSKEGRSAVADQYAEEREHSNHD